MTIENKTDNEIKSVNQFFSKYKTQSRQCGPNTYLMFSGELEFKGIKYTYHLLPNSGFVCKAKRWKSSSEEQKLKLLSALDIETIRTDFEMDVWEFQSELNNLLIKNKIENLDGKSAESLQKGVQIAEQVFEIILGRTNKRIEKSNDQVHKDQVRQTIRLSEYPAFFKVASSMKRKFIAILGEPNSGKTHEAMETLKTAKNGVYLAPLRLLALENYERLKAQDVKVSMITGEEKRITEGATHIVSTVEMLDPYREIDVAVIDEVQMLDDPFRGAAWTAAVCGVPAKTVYLIGSLTAEQSVQALAKRLGCELEIIKKKRKSELVEGTPVNKIGKLRKGDALIAFSRKDVLWYKDILSAQGFSVATIYGNLTPEVRQGQATMFREGKVDILIGTDALAMGLNMPIDRVVFSTSKKFNGVSEEFIEPWLVQQIAGRAGRFGISKEDCGYYCGLDADTHWEISRLMKTKLTAVRSTGFYVTASMEYLRDISKATGETNLHRLLKRFIQDVETGDSFFIPSITPEQLERSQELDAYKLTLEQKFMLSLLPLNTKVGICATQYHEWIDNIQRKRQSLCVSLDDGYITLKNLQTHEDICKLYFAYSWLSYRNPDLFPQGAEALEKAAALSTKIDAFLQKKVQLKKKVA